MSPIEEGYLSGPPRAARPTHCPLCGRQLVYHEWHDWPVYPTWRCDGLIGDIPGLRALWRWVEFSSGRHYTFVVPAEDRARGMRSLRRYDPMTGKRLGGPNDGEPVWRVDAVTMWTLVKDGEPIRTTDGDVALYPSREAAEYVAAHWSEFQAPSPDELQGMSDDQLTARARRLRRHHEEAGL